jgi:hypothetical protein
MRVVNVMEKQSMSAEEHLKQAFYHLTSAVNRSLEEAQRTESAKQRLGAMWEAFLVQFFQYVKEKGKEKKVDMLGWISVSKLTRLFMFK